MTTKPPDYMPTLDDLLDLTSQYVEKLFARRGELRPLYYAVTANAMCMFVPMPPIEDRAEAINQVRELFLAKDVVAYVCAEEFSTGYREAVVLSAESEREAARWGQREIIRPKDGKPYLGPLEMSYNEAFARGGVGMLAKRTTLQ